MMQQSVHQSVLAMARAGMDDHAGRLVDDDEIVVFKKNLEWDRFRLIVDLFRWRLV